MNFPSRAQVTVKWFESVFLCFETSIFYENFNRQCIPRQFRSVIWETVENSVSK